MLKEVKSQIKVSVDLEILWKSLTKDLHIVVPKILPDKVKDVQVLQGDGGLGTILLFNFTSEGAMNYQKEKIVEFDETRHRIGLEVTKGEQRETVVDVTVTYEFEMEIEDSQVSSMTIAHTLGFLKSMETYLLSVMLQAN
ncbi:Phytohormone-binding protein CSBP [Linum perenne]